MHQYKGIGHLQLILVPLLRQSHDPPVIPKIQDVSHRNQKRSTPAAPLGHRRREGVAECSEGAGKTYSLRPKPKIKEISKTTTAAGPRKEQPSAYKVVALQATYLFSLINKFIPWRRQAPRPRRTLPPPPLWRPGTAGTRRRGRSCWTRPR